MIVPGEASESDDDYSPTEAVSASVVPVLPKSAVAKTPSPTSTGATIASQLTSRVSSVTEATVKQLGNLGRQATIENLIGSSYGNLNIGGGGASAADVVSASEKSLLHVKLAEKNASLRKNLDVLAGETVASAPKQMGALVGSYSRTQVYFQDSVLSMQQANHFCAEALESMDDFVEIGARQNFPT
jgi:hypothetical protein